MLRYRDLLDDPAAAVDRACRFLGIGTGHVASIPRDNARSYVRPGWRTATLGPVVRGGAWLGQFAPPSVWRRVSAPLVAGLRSADRSGGAAGVHRPHLAAEERERLVAAFADDIELLSRLTGEDFSDWFSTASRGSFDQRAAVVSARA